MYNMVLSPPCGRKICDCRGISLFAHFSYFEVFLILLAVRRKGGNCYRLGYLPKYKAGQQNHARVHYLSYSLLCKYFRKAVLPAEPLLEADILGTRFEKCVSCGTPIIKKGNRKKYCEKCAQRAHKAQQAEYARRKRAASKNRR